LGGSGGSGLQCVGTSTTSTLAVDTHPPFNQRPEAGRCLTVVAEQPVKVGQALEAVRHGLGNPACAAAASSPGDDLGAQLGVALDGPPVGCGASALLKKDEDRRH